MKKLIIPIFFSLILVSAFSCLRHDDKNKQSNPYLENSRPWTRWWWFASVITEQDIRYNLDWLKANNFGGVEIAWVYPLNRMKKDTINYTPRQEWLSEEWSKMVAYAKQYADSIGLGCDFTFGTLWPFGDSRVPYHEAAMKWGDTAWRQEITASWEYPKKGYVVDHLNPSAFDHYSSRMIKAFPVLKGRPLSSFFVDSWEVETRYLWTPGFEKDFIAKYGYDIRPYMDSIYSPAFADVRYDYMKLISEKAIRFYRQFDSVANSTGAVSRGQCSGAPCDIMSAYACLDVPESEAMLYEPSFSRIVASAAALSSKKVITSETFTCLYGWPRDHHSEEQTADLKLIADALFANGVNHIFWHGKPMNPAELDTVKFYASVHVGSSGFLAPEIPAFNLYLEKVSSYLKRGKTFSQVAVYLPVEDAWMAGDLPKEKQFIWAWGEYEMRYQYMPDVLNGYNPLWINAEFLSKAKYEKGLLHCGDVSFSALFLDSKYLDYDVLYSIYDLAKQGLPVYLKTIPSEPGKVKHVDYNRKLNQLMYLKSVSEDFSKIFNFRPLVESRQKLDFWVKEDDKGLILFFSNPKSYNLKFPLGYGQSLNNESKTIEIIVHYRGKDIPLKLNFRPYQSVLLKIDRSGKVEYPDITFVPKTPVFVERAKVLREKWEVE